MSLGDEIGRNNGTNELLQEFREMRCSRRCENCGRFKDRKHGCGEYVDTCMQDGDAYSNWIPK